MAVKLGDRLVYGLSRLDAAGTLDPGAAAAEYGLEPGARVLLVRGGVLGPLVVTAAVYAELPADLQHGLLSEAVFLGKSEVTTKGRLLLVERVREAYGLRAGDEVLLASAGSRGLHLILRGGLFGQALGTSGVPRLE